MVILKLPVGIPAKPLRDVSPGLPMRSLGEFGEGLADGGQVPLGEDEEMQSPAVSLEIGVSFKPARSTNDDIEHFLAALAFGTNQCRHPDADERWVVGDEGINV